VLECHTQSFFVAGHACPLALRDGDVGVQEVRAGRRALSRSATRSWAPRGRSAGRSWGTCCMSPTTSRTPP